MPDAFGWREGSALVAEQGSQDHAIDWIRAELKARDWKYSELSRRMEQVHKPMHVSVISRLLSDKPSKERRYLSIDQLLGLAKVFDVPMGELLLPPGVARHARAWRLLQEATDVQAERNRADLRLDELIGDARQAVTESPDLRERIQQSRNEVERRVDAERASSDADDRDLAAATGTNLGEITWPHLHPWVAVCDAVLEEGDRTDGR